MKKMSVFSITILGARLAFCQGTLIFDQQSSDETLVREGAVQYGIAIQSFTPSLDSVGFVRLYFQSASVIDGVVNIRSDSPTGTILGTSLSVNGAFNGPVNFIFQTPVSVTPGTTYYLEPVASTSAGTLNIGTYGYAGGMLFDRNGTSSPLNDYWFREGIIVPEPSTAALLLVGLASVLIIRRR